MPLIIVVARILNSISIRAAQYTVLAVGVCQNDKPSELGENATTQDWSVLIAGGNGYAAKRLYQARPVWSPHLAYVSRIRDRR